MATARRKQINAASVNRCKLTESNKHDACLTNLAVGFELHLGLDGPDNISVNDRGLIATTSTIRRIQNKEMRERRM